MGSGELLAALRRPLSLDEAEARIEDTTGSGGAVLFASARGALAATIEALGGGRVAVPGYTCIAVPNAVLSGGGVPVYVDVTPDALSSEVVPSDAAIAIVQDTYGLRAPLVKSATVVRDSSHRPLWPPTPACPIIVTSFEHSKWVSAGQGGLVLTSTPELADALRTLRDQHPASPTRRLRHSLVTALILWMGRLEWRGDLGLAKRVARVVRGLDRSRVDGQARTELLANGVDPLLRGAPNGTVASLVCSQLAKSGWVESHRRHVVDIYDRRADIRRRPEPLVRYPMTVRDPTALEATLAESGWDLAGRWFSAPLHPDSADSSAFGFAADDMPVATALAQGIVNLPTHPLVDDSTATTLIDAALEAGAVPLTIQERDPTRTPTGVEA